VEAILRQPDKTGQKTCLYYHSTNAFALIDR
jgi:hypothetical protein